MNNSPFAQFAETFPCESRDSSMNFLIDNYHLLAFFTEQKSTQSQTVEEKLVGGPDQLLILLRLANEYEFSLQPVALLRKIYLAKYVGESQIELTISCDFNVQEVLSEMVLKTKNKLQEG
jgi:hypothetical protein